MIARSLLWLASSFAQDSAATIPLLDHQQLEAALTRVAAEHPELASIVPVGVSRGGRKIDALRLAAGERKPGRPAILVVANLDGPLVYTSGLALSIAQDLAARYATDAAVKALLDTSTLYFVARANPDGAQARFVSPLAEVRGTGFGIDDDRDGKSGEDAPADVDGDGLVTSMRVPDPEGVWMPDPTDPRALVQADKKKGERGLFHLMPEGRDSDRDEKAGEDPLLDAVVNRNFPQGWAAHKAESGAFPTDEPEARALCDFVLTHKDIALVVTYGALDNLIEKPKSAKDDAPREKLVPAEGVMDSDAALLGEIGTRYQKLTKSKAKGDKSDAGTFQSWCYAQRGLWTLNIAPWSVPLDDADAKGGAKSDAKPEEKGDAKPDEKKPEGDEKPKPSDDAKRLKWIDASGESARFVPWKPFDHPELGQVEIGGFAPYALVEPPAAEGVRIAAAEREFVTTLGELLARPRIVECTAKDLSGGLWQIDAAIENPSFLPLQSASAKRSEIARPARVTLRLPQSGRILAGNRQELASDLPGSGGRKEFRWLVHGASPSAMRVELDTNNAGTAEAIPEVK
ncbi:MAG: M14 family zinc carboxypeptidase [Planctomycetota bacterium]